jgi:dimethylaniline monooxygenase (N-oxide forming)
MKVAVVGGGPSGLVTLKYLITAHNFLPVEPIEAQIGGTFRYRTHEDAEVR